LWDSVRPMVGDSQSSTVPGVCLDVAVSGFDFDLIDCE
jgi:hypothetical protein